MVKHDRMKTFAGKRTTIEVKGSPGISRNLTWNPTKQSYTPPVRGKIFKTHRYIIKDGAKIREERNFNTIEEARTWQVSGGKSVNEEQRDDQTKSPTLIAVIESWRSNWRNLADNTKIQYEKCIPFFESLYDHEIERIQPRDIDNLIKIWMEAANTYRSYRISFQKEFETLTYIFSYYRDNYDESTGRNPFKQRHWDKLILRKKTKAKRKFMTNEEIELFLTTLKTTSHMFYVLAFTQLKQIMRISETAAMDRRNLNAKDRTFILSSHVVWPRIGGAQAYITGGTKTLKQSEEHLVHLFSEVVDMLVTLPVHPKTTLFFHDDGEILTYRQIQYAYDAAFKKAGLPFRGTHVLRHSGSTQFYNESGDLLALQQMGAWKNGRMPEHYAKVLSAKAKDAISKLESRPKLKLVK